ncbi:type I restriction enzyme S subunit [Hydrogenispora ethanolica]|uniref:Type I restriction enzyme S subunit n=1 Tax=Hydrogenispora ethanolica TaxID=1082276 RepID=A0A4R1SA88_HYDET|nr:restriction endonuclease subunit S [Hydrogenispora ethanolica]TCL76425.1 type I restriction enzyme S subunit [Hydrogenispora ethanolica]
MIVKKIGETFEFVRNGSNIKQGIEGGIPITRIETIANGIIDLNRLGYAGIYDEEKYSQYYLQDGDILMSHINSEAHLGKVAIFENINTTLIHGMNLLCLRPNRSILFPKYALYCFKRSDFKRQIAKITKKAVNQASFSTSDLKKLTIPLPPLQKQKRIAAILDKADAIRKKRQESIRLLDEFLQSVFLEMFGQSKDYERNYSIESLDKVSNKITDGEHGTVKRETKGYLYLMARNITTDNKISLKELSFISEDDHKRIYKRCNPEHGDLLLVCVGATIGKVAIVPKMDEFSLARSVALIKPNKNIVNPKFLLHLFNTNYIQKQFNFSKNEVAQAGLYTGQIKKIKLPIPNINHQNNFAEIVEKTEYQKLCLEKSLSDIENCYNSLIQKAFRGELL